MRPRSERVRAALRSSRLGVFAGLVVMGGLVTASDDRAGDGPPNPASRPAARALADGSFVLPASTAIVHGSTLRYEPEPHKNTLGYWVDPRDWAEWPLEIERSGRFEVFVLQGCGRGHGGSLVRVELVGPENALDAAQFVVEDTGHFQNFVERSIGILDAREPGKFSLAVKPIDKARGAVVDIRQVRIVPYGETPRAAVPALSPTRRDRPPNIVLVLADDLGYGELGCYGQKAIRTPVLDRLAAEGMRFTRHYSGSPVCASARCVLLTGRHTGHAYVRDNHEMGAFAPEAFEGQVPLPVGTSTLGSVLRNGGYRTAAIGKWGLGGPGSPGHPNRQGFDLFLGDLCQRVAHNYYPTHLWRNESKVPLGNAYFPAHEKWESAPSDPDAYRRFRGSDYAIDRMTAAAVEFIRESRDRPFFLYLPYPIPHAALQVPDEDLAAYRNAFAETPYLGEKGYLPHPTPRAAYAAMVTRLDRDIGRVLAALDELGIDDDTLILFSSDNGPTFNGGTDSEFFDSTAGLRGHKATLWEGGIRVPLIARWRNHIPAGRITDHCSGFQDILPTLCDVARIETPPNIDGINFAPTLLGGREQKQHDFLYWEYHSNGGSQAVLSGRWKAVRLGATKRPDAPIELYDLEDDPIESTNVAAAHPEIAERLAAILATRTRSPFARWNFGE
jgi:arylsulfatase A